MLDLIQTGTERRPEKLLLYGTNGIGKSTFAACAPKPIFIQTEDRLAHIDCHKFPLATSYADIKQQVRALCKEDHDYQTVVIDTVDWAEQLIWDKVCADKGKKNIEDIGYAKGYIFAMDYWRELVSGLEWLQANKKMMVILLAHAKVEKFDDPAGDAFDRYSPRLHKHANAFLSEWVNFICFARYKVLTKSAGDGFNEDRKKAVNSCERILLSTPLPSHIAKNSRLGMPNELPFVWSEVEKWIYGNGQTEAIKTQEQESN